MQGPCRTCQCGGARVWPTGCSACTDKPLEQKSFNNNKRTGVTFPPGPHEGQLQSCASATHSGPVTRSACADARTRASCWLFSCIFILLYIGLVFFQVCGLPTPTAARLSTGLSGSAVGSAVGRMPCRLLWRRPGSLGMHQRSAQSTRSTTLPHSDDAGIFGGDGRRRQLSYEAFWENELDAAVAHWPGTMTQ